MITKFIISCQSPHAGGNSLNIVDGEMISYADALSMKLVDFCYADSSFSLDYKENGTSIFCKHENDKHICVIYGLLNERDDSGRRIPFCTYTEYQNDIGEVISELSRTLKRFGYTIPLQSSDLSRMSNSAVGKNESYKKLALGVLIAASILAVAAYAIYLSCNEKRNKTNCNETEQTH